VLNGVIGDGHVGRLGGAVSVKEYPRRFRSAVHAARSPALRNCGTAWRWGDRSQEISGLTTKKNPLGQHHSRVEREATKAFARKSS
jgi:hypothetical protein